MYWSNTTVSEFTVIKKPRIKYTPDTILAADPIEVEFVRMDVANVEPDLIEDKEYEISSNAI